MIEKKIKARRCKNCENVFTPARPLEAVCGYNCAIEYTKTLKRNKAISEAKKEKKAGYEKLKTLGQYEAEAKKEFQLFIRLRDYNLPCISCGTTETDLFDGGHYFKAEVFSGLIFDERNVHKQCRKCNRFLSGNELQYRAGLIDRYGREFVEQLESEANAKRVYKFTKAELIAKRLQYQIKAKEQQKKNGGGQ